MKTLPELVHSQYMLQSVVGAITYKTPFFKTFEEVGITSNTTLIVVLLDDEDEGGELIPLSAELSNVEISTNKGNKRGRDEDDNNDIEMKATKNVRTKSNPQSNSSSVIDLT